MPTGYSGTPLPRKLGIKERCAVVLAGASTGFEQTLGELPEGVTLRRGDRGRRDITIWFVRSQSELGGRSDATRKPLSTRSAPEAGLRTRRSGPNAACGAQRRIERRPLPRPQPPAAAPDGAAEAEVRNRGKAQLVLA